MHRIRTAAVVAVTLLVAACSSSPAASSSSAASVAPSSAAASSAVATSASPSTAASSAAASSAAASASTAGCTAATLQTVAPGKLTIGTDNPAFPPYFKARKGGNTPPWDPKQGDPTTGEGFESAVGYAIADKLGYTKDQVAWTVVPFANSFAPGPKKFDFDLNQVSFNPQRATTADLSDGYYFGNQSVVTFKTNPLANAKSVADLKPFQYGVQVGTTSFNAIETIIQPTKQARVYDSNDAAVEALKKKQVDGIVVDLPTADFISNVELDGGVIVGQLSQGQPEHFSAVLAKGSTLTPCVNTAIKALTDDGTLTALASKWLPFQSSVPTFTQ